VLPERSGSLYAWVLRGALIAAAVAVIAGVPGWLEAVLLAFLVVVGVWSLLEGRRRRRKEE
jgi:membrane protein implicated in regulation of membrane protease activity